MTIIARTLSNCSHTLRAPMSWRVRARRTFLLTAPISVPAWLLGMTVIGAMRVVHRSTLPLACFWNAPPRRGRSSGYGSYLAGR